MESTIIGPYPRVDSEIADELRKEKKKTCKNLRLISTLEENLTREVVSEMVSSGIDLPNYGFVDVHDEITWPLESFDGVNINSGQMRKIFYGHNTHYRVGIVNGEIRRKKPVASHLFKRALEVYPRIKLELTGPYTLAKHSILDPDGIYKSVKDLAQAYARLLKEEILSLQNSHEIPLIQFNEPSILASPSHDNSDRFVVRDIYHSMLDGIKIPAALWTFYGKYDDESLELLFSLPVSAVGTDFAWDPGVRNLLKRNSCDKGIGFGVVDSIDRNEFRVQTLDEIISAVKSLDGYVDFNKSYISCNATLKHLDREEARKRLKLISEGARRFD